MSSTPPAKPVVSSSEAKLLFTLIDAACEEGLVGDESLLARWLEIKRVAAVFPNVDRASLYKLVEDVDTTGALNHTWMRERWLTVKRRVENDPADFPASQPPFALR